MATITSFTEARLLQTENATIVDGTVDEDEMVLVTKGSDQIRFPLNLQSVIAAQLPERLSEDGLEETIQQMIGGIGVPGLVNFAVYNEEDGWPNARPSGVYVISVSAGFPDATRPPWFTPGQNIGDLWIPDPAYLETL